MTAGPRPSGTAALRALWLIGLRSTRCRVTINHDQAAPASNPAAKTLRDNGLVGFGFIIIGVVYLALGDNRVRRIAAFMFLILSFLTALASRIARGIQLERESREAP